MTKPMSKSRRMKLRESIVRAMSEAVRDRIVSDDPRAIHDQWDDEGTVWKGPEVLAECRAIWDHFLAWRQWTWPKEPRYLMRRRSPL